MTAAIGTLGQFGLDSSNPVTKRLDFMSENLVMREIPIDSNGVRGTRSPNVDRVRMGLRYVGGTINLQPNPVETGLLLEWIMGASPSGSGPVTYALADTLPSRYVTVDRVAKVFTYAGCKVDKATFRCNQGQALEISLDVVGTTETVGNSGTFPSLSIDTSAGPWIFSDMAISLNSSTLTVRECEIVVDNVIDRERFFNSNTLTTVETLDRNVFFRTMVPYGDWTSLYGASGAGGLDCVATFTNGVYILTMTFGKVVIPRTTPMIPGRREVMLPLEGKAYKTGSTRELSIALATS